MKCRKATSHDRCGARVSVIAEWRRCRGHLDRVTYRTGQRRSQVAKWIQHVIHKDHINDRPRSSHPRCRSAQQAAAFSAATEQDQSAGTAVPATAAQLPKEGATTSFISISTASKKLPLQPTCTTSNPQPLLTATAQQKLVAFSQPQFKQGPSSYQRQQRLVPNPYQAHPQQQQQQLGHARHAAVGQSTMQAAAEPGGSSSCNAIIQAIKAEAAAVAAGGIQSKRQQQQAPPQHQQQAVGARESSLGTAAARLLHAHLSKLPGLANQEQLLYYKLADKPFSAAELVDLYRRYLGPKTVRIVQADINSSSSSRYQTRRVTKSSLIEQQHPRLAPGLLQLRDAVYIFKQTTSPASIPASAVPQNPDSTKLLLALRCLSEWEGRMMQQQATPTLLQLLLLGELQGRDEKLRGDGDLVEVIDLTAEDDREQEQQRQQQLFRERGQDCLAVGVKRAATGGGAS